MVPGNGEHARENPDRRFRPRNEGDFLMIVPFKKCYVANGLTIIRVTMSRTQHIENAGTALDGYGNKTTADRPLRLRTIMAQIVGK